MSALVHSTVFSCSKNYVPYAPEGRTSHCKVGILTSAQVPLANDLAFKCAPGLPAALEFQHSGAVLDPDCWEEHVWPERVPVAPSGLSSETGTTTGRCARASSTWS